MMLATPTTDTPSPGACLDDLLASRFLPACQAARIICASRLPTRLQDCARNLAPDSEWRAYGDADRIFFVIARLHAAKSTSQSAAPLDVYFLDENAAVYCAGVWEHDQNHGWWLDAVLDLSYDCDRGWWFDKLTDPGASIDRRTPGNRRIASDRPGSIEPKVLPAPSTGAATRRRTGSARGS